MAHCFPINAVGMSERAAVSGLKKKVNSFMPDFISNSIKNYSSVFFLFKVMFNLVESWIYWYIANCDRQHEGVKREHTNKERTHNVRNAALH